MKGFLAIILHAHLPFVHHPDLDDPIEEHWLFEAMTETYIPLLLMFEKLRKEKIPFQITMSLSPSLLEMLSNPILIYRYVRRLERQIVLAEKEVHRTEQNKQLSTLATRYQKRFIHIRDAFVSTFKKNLPVQFKRLQEDGYIEILGSTATHGYLPLLKFTESSVGAQIQTGLNYYENVFGVKPTGVWLPECGYYEGLDKDLSFHGIRYCFLETHGITKADPAPEFGVYETVVSTENVAFLGRDPDSSRLVWSAEHGYPSHSSYREFYRDISYDMDFEYLQPFITSQELRIDSGFKYYKITGPTNDKEYYDPVEADKQVEKDAEDFVEKKIAQIHKLKSQMGNEPIVAAPFDAELFGHWWGEGIEWLDCVIRKAAMKSRHIQLTTISSYLKEHTNCFKASPASSSWGANGYNQVWLNEKNEYIYHHLNHGSRQLRKFVHLYPEATGLLLKCLQQAGRELLLAQSSDWSFMIGCETTAEYAKKRVESHIMNLNKLLRSIDENEINEEWLLMLESLNPIFKDIDYKVFG